MSKSHVIPIKDLRALIRDGLTKDVRIHLDTYGDTPENRADIEAAICHVAALLLLGSRQKLHVSRQRLIDELDRCIEANKI